jgi:hypothetical protein
MNQKRGQVTIFIIIGIVLLFLGAIVYYFASSRTQVELPEKFIRDTPQEVLPIRYYVDDCIKIAATKAVEEIGLHGGWVQDPEIATTLFDVSYDSTESNAVSLSLGGAAVPYWYYMKSVNDCKQCQFSSENMPTLQTMSDEISAYVNKKLKECVRDFDPFAEQGFSVKETGEIQTSADIRDGNILIKVSYPVKIEQAGKTYNLDQFAVTLPVNLKKVYELAVKILAEETKVGFLERTAVNIISYASGLDSKSLPPISAAELTANTLVWTKTNVKQKMMGLLATYMPFVTIPYTHNFQIYRVDENSPGYRLRQGLYMGFVMNILQNQTGFENIDVSFNYLNWPMYFDITPSEGELIKPDSWDANFFLLPVFSRLYSFKYDMSYPVVVELRDANAFNKKGYSFMFALENNIRNNNVFKGTIGTAASNLTRTASLFKDESQRISGLVTISVFDDNNAAVEGSQIRYVCGGDSVTLGTTNITGKYAGKFPICKGGIVQAVKIGSLGDSAYIDTQIGQKAKADLVLKKLQQKTANVKIRWPDMRDSLQNEALGDISFSQLLSIVNSASRNRTESETVFVSISKVIENGEFPLNSMLYFDGKVKEQSITLVPGTYEVQAQYMWEPGVYIPAETREIPKGGIEGAVGQKEKIKIPELNITPAPLGGVVLDEQTGYWIVKKDDLDSGKKVTFYILRESEPRKIEQVNRLSNGADLSSSWRSLAEPSWSTK